MLAMDSMPYNHCTHFQRVLGQFLTVPSTTISSLSSQVQFTCRVEAPWFLRWEVDGIQARYLGWRNIRFNTVTTREGETSTLHITASLINNNSEIACILITLSSEEVARAIAFLYIQGLLAPPGNISIVSNSYSSIHLQWTPPFSLMNTNDLNDTMHFVVCIINKLTGSELHETTAQPEYVYQRRDFVHCSAITFKIAAVNQVGRGEFSEGIEAGFAGPLIGVNPLNQTVAAGEWAIFSCEILCSQNEFLTWFVNGSPLPSIESEEGAKIHKSPDYVHGHCNNHSFPNVNDTTHVLSVQFDHSLDDVLSVYCAVVSLCDLNTANCTPAMCFSDIVYLEVTPPRVTEQISNLSSGTSFGDNEKATISFTEFGNNTFNDTQSNINGNNIHPSVYYAVGSVILIGVFLLIVVIILILIMYKLCHHVNMSRNRGTLTLEDNHIYDQIPSNNVPSLILPDKGQNEVLELAADMVDKAHVQPQGPTNGLEMNPCLAYQTCIAP